MTARKRGGLGEDALDAFIPRQDRSVEPAPAVTPSTGRKRSLTVTLPPDLVEELRDVVVFLEQRGARASLAGVVEEALDAWIERVRGSYDVGHRFPPRGAATLRPGPRIR